MFAVLIGIGVAVVVFCVTFVLPIVTITRLTAARRDIGVLQARLDEIESSVRLLDRAVKTASVPIAAPMAPVAPAAPEPAEAPRATRLFTEQAPAPPAPGPEPLLAPPVAAIAPPAPVPATVPATAPAAVPAVELADASVSGPALVPAPVDEADTLETRIGGRWLLYIGTTALVLGIGFFVKYAFDNNWINEVCRVLLGALLGLVMVGGGLRIARRGYPLYGEIVAGGGFAALYISVYAALTFYGLIGRPTAFGLMVLVTVAAAAAAEMHRSRGLAWFAVVGGFVTPFLVGGSEDAQVVLLTYDAILVAGTMLLAERRGWPELNLGAFGLTAITFVGWAGEHYTPAAWVRTEAFLTLFCVMFTAAAIRIHRAKATDNAAITAFVLLTAPIAYHIASVSNLQPQWLALLVYLTCVSLVGVIASVRFKAPWLRLAVFVAVALPLAAWIGDHAGPGWRLAPSIVLLAVYVMNLVAIGERVSREPDNWPKADVLLVHLNSLVLFGGLYTILDAFSPWWSPVLALMLAVWHGGLAWTIYKTSREAGLNSLAMAFAMLGFAIGLKFDDWWAVVGWAVESAAVIWVGLKARREWMRLGGAMLFAFALFNLFMQGFFSPPSGFTPVFNARVGATLVIAAVAFGLALLHRREGGYLADKARPEMATLWVGGNVLLVALLTTEISFYWTMWETVDATADFARQASLSVAWALYGTMLIVIGIMRRYAPIRYLAIALLALTAGKVFLLDLPQHGGLYRIIGFVGLGCFLLLGAWLYQRYRHLILGGD